MNMNAIFRPSKFIGKKALVFFAAVLNASIMDKAYSLDVFLEVTNKIPPGHRYYSKKGYTVKANGRGACMYGVYGLSSSIATYDGQTGSIGIHYASAGLCAFKKSTQKFKVINNDTGDTIGTFTWKKPAGGIYHVIMKDKPRYFKFVKTYHDAKPDALNFWLETLPPIHL